MPTEKEEKDWKDWMESIAAKDKFISPIHGDPKFEEALEWARRRTAHLVAGSRGTLSAKDLLTPISPAGTSFGIGQK